MANEVDFSRIQVPDFLRNDPTLTALNDQMGGGLPAGSHHRISIKASKWRLQDPQGNETIWPHNMLPVVMVGFNQHISKIFYASKYNPNNDQLAPDCFSDNGVGPSSRAEKPQSVTCESCPHHVWGSRVTDSGNKSRACGDFKKVGVILPFAADTTPNYDSPVYELRVPPASLANLASVYKTVQSMGVSAASVIMFLTFDVDAEFPKITFEVKNYITPELYQVVRDLVGSDEVKDCTGEEDRVRTAALPANALQSQLQAPQPGAAMLGGQMAVPAFAAPQAPQQVATTGHVQPAQQPQVAWTDPATTGQQPVLTPAAEPAKKPGRKPKQAAPQAAPAAPPAFAGAPAFGGAPGFSAPPSFSQPAQQAPQFAAAPAPQVAAPSQDQPFSQPAAAAVPGMVPQTNPTLDAILAQVMPPRQ